MEHTPPPPAETPRLYLTPQIAKRKDGVCPTLLQPLPPGSKPPKPKPGHQSNPYTTNSGLLLNVKEIDGIPRDVMELQTIIEAVKKVLKAEVTTTEDNAPVVANLKLKAEGCVWMLNFHPNVGNGAVKNYRMEVVCSANAEEVSNGSTNGGGGGTTYVIDTLLVPKVWPPPVCDGDDSEKKCADDADPPLGYKEAKAAYEKVVYAVRKAVVRLEFPEFPEGLEKNGLLFRECYQLNARVCSPFRGQLRCYPYRIY